MAGTYSYWLILLAVFVATMASFVGLDLASRIARDRRRGMRSLWTVAGALLIGMGVWTMHFIGMLGFHLPTEVSYDIWITLLLMTAVVGCGASLVLVSNGRLNALKLFGGGTLIGFAIVAMHYTGMAAMRIFPPIRYDPGLVGVSILIAVGASVLALWNAYTLRFENFLSAFWTRTGSAVIQGSAIYGMHPRKFVTSQAGWSSCTTPKGAGSRASCTTSSVRTCPLWSPSWRWSAVACRQRWNSISTRVSRMRRRWQRIVRRLCARSWRNCVHQGWTNSDFLRPCAGTRARLNPAPA
jgi:NO-binding membrane sensor protein with MHYT domain